MNITEFLEARIAEDEARAGSGWSRLGDTRWETTNEGQDILTPSAVHAECAAKRAVTSECVTVLANPWDYGDATHTVEAVLSALAAVYRDHPAYQPEWSL